MPIDYDALLLQTGSMTDESDKKNKKQLEVKEDVLISENDKTPDDSKEKQDLSENHKIESEREKDGKRISQNIKFQPKTPSDMIDDAKQRRKKTSVKPSPSENKGVCFIKDFPRELMNIVRRAFPDARNNVDALAAFVIVHSGENVFVNDDVQSLVDIYSSDDPILSISDRLSSIDKQSKDLKKLCFELELGLSYMIFDRLGYRTANSRDTRSIDMLESNKSGSVTDVIERLREQSVQQQKAENIKNGRPIR